jgi:hypothetical protein
MNLGVRARQAWRKTSYWNILLVIFTAVIAFSNGCYGCYARKQLRAMNKQLWEIHQSGIDTHNLAKSASDQVTQMGRQASDTHELALQAKNQADAVRDQLPELRRAAKASQDAANIAKDTLQISQGAYVSIGRKDGVIAEFKKSSDPRFNDGLVMYFQNSGHLPAKFNWGIEPSTVPLKPHPFVPMTRTRNKKTGAITEFFSSAAVIGGESVQQLTLGDLPPAYVDFMSKSNQPLTINGAYEYCDELGRYSCKRFSLYYQRIPYDTFRLLIEEECPDLSFLGKPTPGPDEEALPLCTNQKTPRFPNR